MRTGEDLHAVRVTARDKRDGEGRARGGASRDRRLRDRRPAFRGSRARHRDGAADPRWETFVRIFVRGHLMGLAVLGLHALQWGMAAAYHRVILNESYELWGTLRLTDGTVLGRWVLGVVSICLLLAGLRDRRV